MTSYEFVVIKGKEDYEEFRYKDLRLYVFNGALWALCRYDAEDVKVRELYELDTVAEGEPVVIELSEKFLETCRNERAVEELDHRMGINEFYNYLGTELTPEEYFEKYYKIVMKQMRKDLIKRWHEAKENSLSLFEIDIITDRLAEYLFELDDQDYPPRD
jgi:hypothetical protein